MLDDYNDPYFVYFVIMIVSYFVYEIVKFSRKRLDECLVSYEYDNAVNSFLRLNIRSISNSNIECYNETTLNDERTNIEELLCCVCKENKVKLMIVPCNHACLCLNCRKHMNLAKCPMCQCNIINYSRIYI